MAKFTIREAKREDCKDVLVLIKLANFENMPDGPKIGPDILQRDGFDTAQPFFRCFVAELDPSENENGTTTNGHKSESGRLVGYALYYYSYSTWNGPSLYLEDIYVTAECRSLGIGSALFDRVAKEAYDKDCCRLDFVVLNWNPATEFYKRKGGVDLTAAEGWHHYRLEREALKQLATHKKDSSVSS